MDSSDRLALYLLAAWAVLLAIHVAGLVALPGWHFPDDALNRWSFLGVPLYLISWWVAVTYFREPVRPIRFGVALVVWLALWWLSRPSPGMSVSRAAMLPEMPRVLALWSMRLWPWLFAITMITWLALRARRSIAGSRHAGVSAV